MSWSTAAPSASARCATCSPAETSSPRTMSSAPWPHCPPTGGSPTATGRPRRRPSPSPTRCAPATAPASAARFPSAGRSRERPAPLLDPEGRPVPIGVPGELWIGGDGVARGYRADPELTAARFGPDPARPGGRRYRSGDRARWRPDGTIEFLDRVDRQVKIRGVRIEPAEVEESLLAHPDISAAAVIPFERAPGDRALAAYVVAADDGALDRADLRRHAVERLPAAMVPTAWVTLPRLPLNANGKVDRSSLPAPGPEHLAATGGAGPADQSRAPRRAGLRESAGRAGGGGR